MDNKVPVYLDGELKASIDRRILIEKHPTASENQKNNCAHLIAVQIPAISRSLKNRKMVENAKERIKRDKDGCLLGIYLKSTSVFSNIRLRLEVD
jgi:hypothetical protein